MVAEFLGVEVGSWADWVSGTVAAVALLIAVNTQRKQANEARESDARDLQVRVEMRHAPQHDNLQVLDVHLVYEGRRTITQVVAALAPMEGEAVESDFPTFVPSSSEYGDEGRAGYSSDQVNMGAAVVFKDLVPGERVQALLYTKHRRDRELYVLFTDSRGRRWHKNVYSGALRKATADEGPRRMSIA